MKPHPITFRSYICLFCVLWGSALLRADTVVRFETTLGDFEVQLYDRHGALRTTPLTVSNFLTYVQADVYNGSFFHRSMPGFILQGGGFGLEGTSIVGLLGNPAVVNEPGNSNVRGTMAMAKLDGDPDSATWKFLLAGLKLMDTEPVDIQGSRVSPKDVFCKQLPKTLTPKKCVDLVKENKIQSQAVLAVDVKGTKAGKKLHYKMWTDSPNIEKACSMIPGTSDVSWITSVPASILSLMILRGQIKRTGVFPCEVFNKEERKIFFEGIKEWDVTIHKQITSEII